MKFVHTSDLHIGKIINEFNMLEDQCYILNQIQGIIRDEEADGIIIAGDIYDRPVPSAEAVRVFDEFISSLAEDNITVLMISGNHDSPERTSFLNSVLSRQNIYTSGVYNGKLKKAVMEDEYGAVNIYLLPFMKPQVMKHYYPEMETLTFEEGIRKILMAADIDWSERNILVTHYFVTNNGKGPELSDSEQDLCIGGVENVDVSCFGGFDYTALGHIHGPQRIMKDTVRYAGSPIKYSFSEVFHKKSVTIVEIAEKGNIKCKVRQLKPMRDMRKIKGRLKELLDENIIDKENREDYIQVTLTDINELIDPMGSLRTVYPNIMQIVFEKNTMIHEKISESRENIKSKNKMDVFKGFYESVTERKLDEDRLKIMEDIIEKMGEGDI